MRLEGKIAVVTGAGNGLGKEIALAYAKEGAQVVVANRSYDNGMNTVQEITENGDFAYCVQVDVSKENDIERLFEEVDKKFGRIDILVNNAGITGRSYGDGPVTECSLEAWDLIMGVNLRGTFVCSKYGLKRMQEQGEGVIVNMSSVLGMVGCQDFFKSHAYQTTKAGIIGLTRSIAAYYAKYGIRANVIAPGLIDSKATQKLQQNEEVMEFTRRMQPLGALGSPKSVADTAIFLASEESSFITGQAIAVDGGWTMQ